MKHRFIKLLIVSLFSAFSLPSLTAQSLPPWDDFWQSCHSMTPRAAGIAGLAADRRLQLAPQAWFDTAVYPAQADALTLSQAPTLYFPYFSGDTLFLPTQNAQFLPSLAAEGLWRAILMLDGRILFYPSQVPALAFDADQIGEAGDIGLLLAGQGNPQAGDCQLAYSATLILSAQASARVSPSGVDVLIRQAEQDIYGLVFPQAPAYASVHTLNDAFVWGGFLSPPHANALELWLTPPASASTPAQPRRMTLSPTQGRLDVLDGVWRMGTSMAFDQVGVWQIRLGANPVPSLQPNSGQYALWGAPEGYRVYVTQASAPALSSPSPSGALSQPLALVVDAPPDWTDSRAYVSVGTRYALLDEREIPIRTGQVRYLYDANALRRAFPSLSADDEVRVTLAIEGTLANGERDIRVRIFTIKDSQYSSLD